MSPDGLIVCSEAGGSFRRLVQGEAGNRPSSGSQLGQLLRQGFGVTDRARLGD